MLIDFPDLQMIHLHTSPLRKADPPWPGTRTSVQFQLELTGEERTTKNILFVPRVAMTMRLDVSWE